MHTVLRLTKRLVNGLYSIGLLRIGLLVFVPVTPSLAEELFVYMAPTATPGNGLTPTSPVATLSQAQAAVAKLWADKPAANIVVRISPGTYSRQTVAWTTVNPGTALRIEAHTSTKRPVFDGEGVISTSFFSMPYEGGSSRITLKSLHIKNYVNGVSFKGSRDDFGRFNSNNSIIDCVFERIGNAYWVGSGEVPMGYSAIGLSNSDFNVVSGNSFREIRNNKDTRLHLHPIYLSHNASNNEIRGNVFEGTSGSAVRVRDYSNDNEITRNEFKLVERPAVETWFCDSAIRSDCTKSDECPNVGTAVIRNTFASTTKIFENTVPYDRTNSNCSHSIPTGSLTTVTKNVDTTNGACLIRTMKGCPFFEIAANTYEPDYISQDAQTDPLLCQSRDSAYHGSCTSRTGDAYDIMSTRATTNSPSLHYESSYGYGCMVRAENCPRMGLVDGEDKLDSVPEAQTSASVCLGRTNDWYSSCSREDPTGNRFVRLRYHSGGSSSTSVWAHGCVVHANFCPRMGFDADGHQLDADPAAQESESVCVARAKTWWSSCTANLTDKSSVLIKSSFYRNGILVRSATHPVQ